MPTESYTQSKILKYLHARGGYWVKYHASGYTPEGVPDILGCYQGIFVALEVKNVRYKNPYSVLRSEQIINVLAIRNAKGMAFAVNSVNQVAKILDELDAIISRNG